MSEISQSKKNLRGILFMMLAMASFVLNDALVKLARVEWDTGQILIVRGCFALALLAVWVRLAQATDRLGMLVRKELVLRGALEAMIAMAFITALGQIALADITAILMLAPLVITALSIVFLDERVGWRRWTAVLVGFIGMLLVVQPGSNTMPTGALILALISVLGVGARDILTRRLPADAPSIVVSVTSVIGTMLGGAVLTVGFSAWQPVTPYLLLLSVSAAGFVVLGNFSIIEACRDVELSAVTPFRYSMILWAILLGALIFGSWPTPVALAGIALIGVSGLYTLHRERLRRMGG